MVKLHATALGLNFSNVAAKAALILASAALVAGCATAPWSPGNAEARLADRSMIYLETNQFLWADAKQREQLACANGTAVICTKAQNRLSLSNCGCLPDYN